MLIQIRWVLVMLKSHQKRKEKRKINITGENPIATTDTSGNVLIRSMSLKVRRSKNFMKSDVDFDVVLPNLVK